MTGQYLQHCNLETHHFAPRRNGSLLRGSLLRASRMYIPAGRLLGLGVLIVQHPNARYPQHIHGLASAGILSAGNHLLQSNSQARKTRRREASGFPYALLLAGVLGGTAIVGIVTVEG